MSLLDDARKIAGREPLSDYGEVSSCIHCHAVRISPYDFQPVTNHLDWCSWLSMPRIVAVLEAAERLVQANAGEYCEDHGGEYQSCIGCADFYAGDEFPPDRPKRYVIKPHAADCEWQALVAVLRGEVAQSNDQEAPH